MIAGILATVVAPDAGIAIISASQTQSAFSQLTHSRSAEQEADRIGMQTLSNAGFDARASSEFLTKLAAQIRYKYKPPAFYSLTRYQKAACRMYACVPSNIQNAK